MKKGTLLKTSVVVALLLLVAAALLTFFSLGAVVKRGIESVGPRITGTPVAVGAVRISPFSGNGELRALVVGNPPGFKTDNAFRLDRVAVTLEPRSLTGDRLVVREIVIQKPVITYELGMGSSNYEEIMKSVSRFTSPDNQDEAARKQVQIDHFVLDEAVIRLSTPAMLGGSSEVRLGRIELCDLGREGTLKDTVRVLAAAVGAAVTKAVAGQLPGLEQGKQVWRGTVAGVKESAGQIVHEVKGLFTADQGQPVAPAASAK